MNLPIQHLTSDLDDKYMELAAQLAKVHAIIDTLQTSILTPSNQVSLLEALKVEKSQSDKLTDVSVLNVMSASMVQLTRIFLKVKWKFFR
jgi:hypothetical protein